MATEQGKRKLAAIVAADIVGYSRLAGADEDRTLARLRALRGDLIDPAIAAHHGRVVKRTGDGTLAEFRSVVDAVRCAIEMQNGMTERNAGLPPERRIEFRVGIHLGDVVEEADGDLMGDGVNIAARLEGIAEPGGICLSAMAYESVRDKVEATFADLGEKELKNIARPVRVFAIARQQAPSHSSPPLGAERLGEVGDSRAAGDAAAPHRATLRVASPPPASGGRLGGGLETAPPRLSIVVLPFANIGGDPEQEYFVDGVTESLTTDLSRISGSFVIARNTAFTYKGKPVDVKQIARELNVRYVLEGSVQRGGNRMRVNVQLIDAETGNHLWAERFDKPVADLFDMQDEIVSRLASQLNAQLIAAEARRAERAPHPDSMDLTFRGWAYYNRGTGMLAEACNWFHQALALDPANVEALAGLALADARMVFTHIASNPPEFLDEAERMAGKALTLAPQHAVALLALGIVYTYSKRQTEAISAFESAIASNPSFAGAHANLGLAIAFSGRFGEGIEHHTRAFRLSPRDPQATLWCNGMGVAEFMRDRDEVAANWFRQAIELDRNYANAYFYLSATLTRQGRTADAQRALKDGLAVNPNFTIARMRATSGAATNNPAFLEGLERMFEYLAKAGVPEG